MSKKPEDEQCPACGYYCNGKGHPGCINKPSMIKSTPKYNIEDEIDSMITEFLNGIGHPELIPHCMDTDENSGERLHQRIRQYAAKERIDERKLVRKQLRETANRYSVRHDLTPISAMHGLNNKRIKQLKEGL